MHLYKIVVSTLLIFVISFLYVPSSLAISRGEIIQAIPNYLAEHPCDAIGWHKARDTLILFTPIMTLLDDKERGENGSSDFHDFRNAVLSYFHAGSGDRVIYDTIFSNNIVINPRKGSFSFGIYDDFLTSTQDAYLRAFGNNQLPTVQGTSGINAVGEEPDRIESIIATIQHNQLSPSEARVDNDRPLFFSIPSAFFLNDRFIARWVKLTRSIVLSLPCGGESKDACEDPFQDIMELLAGALLHQYSWLIKTHRISEFEGVLRAIGGLLISPDILSVTNELTICSIPNLSALMRSHFTQEMLDTFASHCGVTHWENYTLKLSPEALEQRSEMVMLSSAVDGSKRDVKEKSDHCFKITWLFSDSDSEKKQVFLSGLFDFFYKRLSRRNSGSTFSLYGSYALRIWLKHLYGHDCGLVAGDNIDVKASLSAAVEYYLYLLGKSYNAHASPIINAVERFFAESTDLDKDVLIGAECGTLRYGEMFIKFFVGKNLSGFRYVLVKCFELSKQEGIEGECIGEARFNIVDESLLINDTGDQKDTKMFYFQSGCNCLRAIRSWILLGWNKEHLKSVFDRWEKEERKHHKLSAVERQFFYKIYDYLTGKAEEVEPIVCDKALLSEVLDSSDNENPYFEFLRCLSRCNDVDAHDYIAQFEYIQTKINDGELLFLRCWHYAWHANQLFSVLSSLNNSSWVDIKRIIDIGFIECRMLVDFRRWSADSFNQDRESLYSSRKVPVLLSYICDTFNACEESNSLTCRLLSRYIAKEKAADFNSLIVILDRLLTFDRVGTEALKYKGLLFEIYFSVFNDLSLAEVALSDAMTIWNQLRHVDNEAEAVKSFFSNVSNSLDRLLEELDGLDKKLAAQRALSEDDCRKLSMAYSLVRKVRAMKHTKKIESALLFKEKLLIDQLDQLDLIYMDVIKALDLEAGKDHGKRTSKKHAAGDDKRKRTHQGGGREVGECSGETENNIREEVRADKTIRFYPENWELVRDQAFYALHAKKYSEAVNGYEEASGLLPANASDECRDRLFIATTEARFEWVRSEFVAIEGLAAKVRKYKEQFDKATSALAQNDYEGLDANKSELMEAMDRLIGKMSDIRSKIMVSTEDIYRVVSILKDKANQPELKDDQDEGELSSLELFFAEERYETLFNLQEKQSEILQLIDNVWGVRRNWLQLIREKSEVESGREKKNNRAVGLQKKTKQLKKQHQADRKRIDELRKNIEGGL